MHKVLFLCTGNSCRSIIAEALLKQLGQNTFQSYSAGSRPTGKVNPDSLAVLKDYGIDSSGFSSKSWDDLSDIDFDIVITVCDNAASESCPVYLGNAIKVHWGISDPDKVKENRKQAFTETYKVLRRLIEQLVELNEAEINSHSLDIIGKTRL